MKPLPLREIWLQHGCIRARVRNTRTLKDFLTLSISAWDGTSPTVMNCVACVDDTLYKKHDLCCLEDKWALLSSYEELSWMKGRPERWLVAVVRKHYLR